MMLSLKLSKVGFPGRVVPQIEFLKGHFGSHWNLLKKKVNENSLIWLQNLWS